MSRKTKITIGVMTGLLTVLVGTALAFSNVFLILGNTPVDYDFGNVLGSYIGPEPATVMFHEFTMKPGDTVPWHYHKAVAYVVLERGTLSEKDVNPATQQCESFDFKAPVAFVEQPGQVHTVTNNGQDSNLIIWSTAFPKSDGIAHILPQFKAGGIYFTSPPAACR